MRMPIRLAQLAITAMAGASASLALAHHSYAMFEKREIKLQGTVKEFQWTNPHIFLQLLVPDAAGKTIEWSVEGDGPGALARRGWKFNTLKAGDKVTVGVAPLRDGSHAGGLIFVQKEGGPRMDGGPLASLDPERKPAESNQPAESK